ncbi:MAG: enoyl-CoA hydratase/isomerase family protein [Magnetospirillum sp.]|nr:enoyl-CoA hydratase/isomerase family protein [Magnetospirillum sp.]
MIEVSAAEGIGVIRLDRPEARNALSNAMIEGLAQAVDRLEQDEAVRVLVLTGGPPFCAGADIAEMRVMSVAEAIRTDFSGCCDRLATCAKPLIAAVEGYALGGGCELVEMCDIVIAAENARFGHPEITLGTLSGAGGTQRLARAVGRAKAMDLILTGRLMFAPEAERIGLVSEVVPTGEAMARASAVAAVIAARPPNAVRFAKEAVHRAVSVGLDDGLRLERRLFHLSFATGELHEGMERFLDRR